MEAVWEEAVSIWPDLTDQPSRAESFISIGTGKLDVRDFGNDLQDIMKSLVQISTDTEDTAKRFYKKHVALGLVGRYFRFNVSHGLRKVKLSDIEKTDHIETMTQQYLEEPDVHEKVELFGKTKTSRTGKMCCLTAKSRGAIS